MENKKKWDNVIEIERHLRKVDYIIRRKGREILSDFNITAPQFIALQILMSQGELTIGELSQKMSLACSTITDLIDRMEKNKLVVRKRDNNDKRVVRIEVLPLGYELVHKVVEKRRKFLAGKLEGFEEKEMIFLKESLQSLYIAMKESQDS